MERVEHAPLDRDAYELEQCPVCGMKGAFYFGRNGYYLDRCPACRFVYVRNMPSERQPAEYYASGHADNGAFIPDTQKSIQRWFSKGIESWFHARNIVLHAAGRRRLLEIGYGEGHLLKALKATGRFELEGIDCATALLAHLRAHGLRVFAAGLADRQYPGGRFDFIVGFYVLEHVQNLDAFINEVRRVLADGGRVYFVAPCVTHFSAVRAGTNWKMYDPPGRLWHFSVKAMKRFLTDRGFRVIFAHCISNRPHLTVLAEKQTGVTGK
ncbi:class I SAM-dependent methyltransferase [Paraburkholderia sp. 2C]